MSERCANSEAENEYQRQQEFTASDYAYAERFRENLDIVACDAYSDPSSDYVCDALANDEKVISTWFRLVNCDGGDFLYAMLARDFIRELDRYIKRV